MWIFSSGGKTSKIKSQGKGVRIINLFPEVVSFEINAQA
jgi:hypothetical protein